ncbi:hypothetical protein [Phytoactinopolyspora limicola]|uniref:hypothetical protein n=1 Tax=Phytoactinopolyspora limicola TaxID=2715536 RepID=UPI00140E81B6|nr:hypothetical protein [Phytoactinopolyspora limicola]
MSDTTGGPAAGQGAAGAPGSGPDAGGTAPPISDEDTRQYLAQLRSAPAEQVLGDVLSSLLMAAQAKLGRKDARLLIDTSGVIVDHTRPFVSDQLAAQVAQILDQLRFAQVEAERQAGAQGENEANDLQQAPAPPTAGQAAASPAPPQQPQQPSPASKLWIPGRR